MEQIILNAQIRDILGQQVKKLRNEGNIPAVLYGKDFENISLMLNKSDFRKVSQKAGGSTIIDLKADGKTYKALIQEIQVDPVTDEVLHVDMYKVNMKEEIRTEISLEFIGESPAVIDLEGNFMTNKDALEVECMPDKLVGHIDVDISVIKTFDDIIKVGDLVIPEGIKALNDSEEIIAQVTPPRSEEEMAEMEETPVADQEKAAIENIEAQSEAERAEKEGEENKGNE